MIGLWLRGLLRRSPARLLAASAGIAIAVALVAGLGSFLVSSEATMTHRAASQGDPLDARNELRPSRTLRELKST